MNIADKIFLLKNGYTKEEVEAMAAEENVSENDKNGGAPAVIPDTPTEKKEADVTENDKEPKPEPKPEPEESETEKLIKALGLKLDNAISAIHKSNVNNLESAGNEQLTVEDVLAQVINPNYKGGKN